jgi:hypothetical protein
MGLFFVFQWLVFLLPIYFIFWGLPSTWPFIDRIVNLSVLIATFLAAAATIVAAYAARQSYRATWYAPQGHLFYELLARYSSEKMHESLRIIGQLDRVRQEDDGKFLNALLEYKARSTIHAIDLEKTIGKGSYRERLFQQRNWEEISEARRQVSHFFLTAFDLYEIRLHKNQRVLDRPFFEKICLLDGFELLHPVVEWLELAHNPKYDREKFTNVLRQSGWPLNEIQKLEQRRPPRTWDGLEKMMRSNKAGAEQEQPAVEPPI